MNLIIQLFLCQFLLIQITPKVCPSLEINFSDIKNLTILNECTIINGHLYLFNLQSAQCSDPKFSFTKLKHVLSFLFIEHAACEEGLSDLLPSLESVQGRAILEKSSFRFENHYLIKKYALVLHNTKFSYIGLYNLKYLGLNGASLMYNPNLCYIDTIDWNLMTHSRISYWSRGNSLECSNVCPTSCPQFCWDHSHCQDKSVTELAEFNKVYYSTNDAMFIDSCSNDQYILDQRICLKGPDQLGSVYSLFFKIEFKEEQKIEFTCRIQPNVQGMKTNIYCLQDKSITHNCGHVNLKFKEDLNLISECVQLESLLINFQEEDKSLEMSQKFYDSFKKLRSIKYFLWIYQCPYLRTLDFLNNVESINKENSKKRRYSMEISWNSNLDSLWNGRNFKDYFNRTKIDNETINTQLIMTNNANLCRDTIKKFFYDNFKVSETSFINKASFSNGFLLLCNPVCLSLKTVRFTRENIHFETRNQFNSHVFIDDEFGKISLMYSRREESPLFVKTEWKIKKIDNDLSLTNLQPNSTYVVYATNEKGRKVCISNLLKFDTIYGHPNATLYFQSSLITHDSVKLEWLVYKDYIDLFRIKIFRENERRETESAVDNCEYSLNSPPLFGTQYVEETKQYAKAKQEKVKENCFIWSIRNGIDSWKSIRERQSIGHHEKILIHTTHQDELDLEYKVLSADIGLSFQPDDIQGVNQVSSYEKSGNPFLPLTDDNSDFLRFRRQIIEKRYIRYNDVYVKDTFVEEDDLMQSHSYLFTGLKHFTDYQFSISACSKFNGNLSCSEERFLKFRTKPFLEANKIEIDKLVVIGDGASLKLYWKELKDANGPVVRYWMRIKRLTMSEIRYHYHALSSLYRFFSFADDSMNSYEYACLKVQNGHSFQLNPNDTSVVTIFQNRLERSTVLDTLSSLDGEISTASYSYLDDGVYEIQMNVEGEFFYSDWSLVPSRFQIRNTGKKNEFTDLIDLCEFERLDSRIVLIVLSSFSLVLLVILVILIGIKIKFFLIRRRSIKDSILLFNKLLGVFKDDEWELDNSCICLHPEDMPKALSKKNLPIGQILGMGSFGLVYQGWMSITSQMVKSRKPIRVYLETNEQYLKSDLDQDLKSKYIPVALKTMKESASGSDVKDFLTEASFMKQFQSAHIVQLLGLLCKQLINGEKPMVVMELMENGDLNNYLVNLRGREERHSGRIPDKLAIQWAGNIADGMMYLHSKGIIHRDLATRNCFVSGDLVIKIGDFGLARNIQDHYYYRKNGQARVPIRWMAPETLDKAFFTTKSDVWSFGVTLWEIATFATLPFYGKTHPEVTEYVLSGKTLDIPLNFPDLLADIMKMCWTFDRRSRPEFLQIISLLYTSMDSRFKHTSYYSSTI